MISNFGQTLGSQLKEKLLDYPSETSVEELAQDYADLDQQIIIMSEQLCDFSSSADAHEE